MYFTSSTPTNFWTFEGIQKQNNGPFSTSLTAILTTKELNLKYKVNYGSLNILKSPLCEICIKVNLKTQNFGIVTLWG